MRRRTSSSNRKPSVVSLAATLQRQAIPCCAGNGVMDAILLIPWDAPSLLAPKNLTPSTVSSAANATNESGGEAEIAGGGGVRRGAATRSLRSGRGVAHSGTAASGLVGVWRRLS